MSTYLIFDIFLFRLFQLFRSHFKKHLSLKESIIQSDIHTNFRYCILSFTSLFYSVIFDLHKVQQRFCTSFNYFSHIPNQSRKHLRHFEKCTYIFHKYPRKIKLAHIRHKYSHKYQLFQSFFNQNLHIGCFS